MPGLRLTKDGSTIKANLEELDDLIKKISNKTDELVILQGKLKTSKNRIEDSISQLWTKILDRFNKTLSDFDDLEQRKYDSKVKDAKKTLLDKNHHYEESYIDSLLPYHDNSPYRISLLTNNTNHSIHDKHHNYDDSSYDHHINKQYHSSDFEDFEDYDYESHLKHKQHDQHHIKHWKTINNHHYHKHNNVGKHHHHKNSKYDDYNYSVYYDDPYDHYHGRHHQHKHYGGVASIRKSHHAHRHHHGYHGHRRSHKKHHKKHHRRHHKKHGKHHKKHHGHHKKHKKHHRKHKKYDFYDYEI